MLRSTGFGEADAAQQSNEGLGGFLPIAIQLNHPLHDGMEFGRTN